jgi:tetratricopeptide (TPR) repeat protein
MRALVLALLLAGPADAHGPFHGQIEAANERVARQPRDARALVARGELYRQHGDFDQALADFAAAARALPPADVDLLRGGTLVDAGRAHQAMVFLDRHLARHPDSAAGYLERARAHEAVVAPQAAADDYQRGVGLLPHPSVEQYLHRLRLQLAAGRPEAALGGLDEAIAQLGPLPELEKPAITLEMEARRWQQALDRLKALPPPERAALAKLERQVRRQLGIYGRNSRVPVLRAGPANAASRPGAGESSRSRGR